MCQKSKIIESFCTTNELFIVKIVEKLKAANYPVFPVVSIKDNDAYTVFDLYLSALYMSSYLKLNSSITFEQRKEVLQKSCQFGSVRAFVELFNLNYEIIENEKVDEDNKEKAVEQIWDINKKLPDLYWAAGYVYAGASLFKLAEYFKIIEAPRSQTLIEQAVKNFLCAYLLRDHEYSNQVIADVVGDKGVYSMINSEKIKFSSWHEAINIFKNFVNDKYITIEKQAKQEIEELLHKKHPSIIQESNSQENLYTESSYSLYSI